LRPSPLQGGPGLPPLCSRPCLGSILSPVPPTTAAFNPENDWAIFRPPPAPPSELRIPLLARKISLLQIEKCFKNVTQMLAIFRVFLKKVKIGRRPAGPLPTRAPRLFLENPSTALD